MNALCTDKGPTKDLRICGVNVESLLDHSAASHHVARGKVRRLSPRSCNADLPPMPLTFKVLMHSDGLRINHTFSKSLLTVQQFAKRFGL
jgi:hypothetical protein